MSKLLNKNVLFLLTLVFLNIYSMGQSQDELFKTSSCIFSSVGDNNTQELNYKIFIPCDWVKKASTSSGANALFVSKSDSVSIQVGVGVTDLGVTVTSLQIDSLATKEGSTMFEQALGNAHIKSIRRITINNLSCIELEGGYDFSDPVKSGFMRIIAYLVFYETKVFIISCEAISETKQIAENMFLSKKRLFALIANTFKVLPR